MTPSLARRLARRAGDEPLVESAGDLRHARVLLPDGGACAPWRRREVTHVRRGGREVVEIVDVDWVGAVALGDHP